MLKYTCYCIASYINVCIIVLLYSARYDLCLLLFTASSLWQLGLSISLVYILSDCLNTFVCRVSIQKITIAGWFYE